MKSVNIYVSFKRYISSLVRFIQRGDNVHRIGPVRNARISALGRTLGTRFDDRLSFLLAYLGLVVATLAGAITIWAILPLTKTGVSWLLPILAVAAAPSLVAVGAVALAHSHNLLSELRAVFVSVFFVTAFLLAGLAQVAWNVGFAAADRSVPAGEFAATWPWLFVTAWAVGGAAIAVFLSPLLRHATLRPATSVILATAAGLFLTPMIGLSFISPYVGAIAAIGLGLLSVLTHHHRSPAQVRQPNISAVTPVATRRVVRFLAFVAAIGSAIGIGYALTGSHWGGTADSTTVMTQGITITLAAEMPLLAALGILMATHSRARKLHTWGPLLLFALALGTVAIAYRQAPDWERMVTGFTAASFLGGAAFSWWLRPRLSSIPRARTAITILLGAAYAVFLGIFAAPLIAFATPLLAIALIIWGPRRAKTAM